MDSSDRINKIIKNIVSPERIVDERDAKWLCRKVIKVFANEPSLLEIDSPVKICGDIHGQLSDLLKVFKLGGIPPKTKYLFLGDYVDRGENSVEVICLLYALKIQFPEHIYLLRGNHESDEMTEAFGFLEEVSIKLGQEYWEYFIDSFNYMPIAAIVLKQYFCVHGGISPDLKRASDINNIKRPSIIPGAGILADLLWSDPDNQIETYGPNWRGETVSYGLKAVKKFLKRSGLSCIIRGHQVARNGYNFPFLPSRCVITLFTASNYPGALNNKAAYLEISSGKGYVMHFLRQNTKKKKPIEKNESVQQEMNEEKELKKDKEIKKMIEVQKVKKINETGNEECLLKTQIIKRNNKM
ncbi:Ser/Thr protein phosphatase [Tritrichomonas foetus]|uniref:Serine/threonine-protein phosphatase n=1 Tax=Tritrichomonas foetus TaxID=1144522 RepID=A0A1J4JF35_9EUKA|nr:Ser/Thr protein phosphatase [Tritrichomonas foetus]|eukprot:OHS96061.1 Ser/Thr protein phosphatase [Tritrichomonas foetus]